MGKNYKTPSDLLRRGLIFYVSFTHIISISPERNNENDDDVIVNISFLFFIRAQM